MHMTSVNDFLTEMEGMMTELQVWNRWKFLTRDGSVSAFVSVTPLETLCF